jgi:hypothetical protein
MPGRPVNPELLSLFSHNNSVVTEDINSIFVIPHSRQCAFSGAGFPQKKDSSVFNDNGAGVKNDTLSLCQVMHEQKFHGGPELRIDEAITVVTEEKIRVFEMMRQKEGSLEINHFREKSYYGHTVFTEKSPD